MLSVENLDVAYRRTQVLFDVSMDVPAGGLVCVMGRNGVGKTTLLNTVMGVLKPSAGRVLWEGTDITSMRPHERIRAAVTNRTRVLLLCNPHNPTGRVLNRTELDGVA
ncbi:MAG: aminotransferase class I/II-fold pyridoxal phosphate-dependent enzyme, partial [Acidimicrobiales bacterium]|nr:aminotransferase class I/II-fold pyridoxal phosphate-dependent enzyme [Acidimicrobiales bacterium]